MDTQLECHNKTVNMKNYMREYREKHKDDGKIKCVVCGHYYSKLNKSHHYKSNRHELAELRSNKHELIELRIKMDQVKQIL
jgi:hypothetical protein